MYIVGVVFLIVIGLCILILVVYRVSRWYFRNAFATDVGRLLQATGTSLIEILTDSDLQTLPEVVQRYIRTTGAVGKPKVHNFCVRLEGSLRQDRNTEWMKFTSIQYNGVDDPARLFFMDAVMKRLPVAGYHRFRNGHASMDIRLLSFIPVERKSGTLMDVAETVTFFNDMCVMAPATLIDKRISWSNCANDHVRASFSHQGIVVTADLYFNANGELIDFVSRDRYALQRDGSMRRYPWSTPLTQYRDIGNNRHASCAEAIITMPDGDFCYGRFNVVDIGYNVADYNMRH